MKGTIAIVGIYQTKYEGARNDKSLEELIFEAARGALEDAGVARDEVQSIVTASSDLVDGRVISTMVTSGPAGGYKRDIINTSSSGDHALILGYLRVLSGIFPLSLVMSWAKCSETPLAQVESLCFDPFYHRPLGLNGVIAAALQASAYVERYQPPEDLVARVVVKNRRNALDNPLAHLRKEVSVEEVLGSGMVSWPIRELEAPPESDGVCALVLASEEKARSLCQTPAWIEGIGWATDTYWLGDRNLSELTSLESAARRAYTMAGVTDPRGEIDVAELHDVSPYHELMAYEALGFCAKGEGGRLMEKGFTALGGPLPVNPSGGALSTNPVFASGLIRVAEAALQVMGRAGKRQIDGVRKALAQASHGFAGQGNSVFILGRDS